MNDQAKSGHIVNVSSASAYLPSRALPAYATSKSAVLMLTECLRAELADQGIGVSAICPGIIDTPITGRARFVGVDDDEQSRRRDAAQRLYHKRGFTADRVARAIVDAVQGNRAEVPVSVEASGMRLIGRWAPGLARRLARLAGAGDRRTHCPARACDRGFQKAHGRRRRGHLPGNGRADQAGASRPGPLRSVALHDRSGSTQAFRI